MCNLAARAGRFQKDGRLGTGQDPEPALAGLRVNQTSPIFGAVEPTHGKRKLLMLAIKSHVY